MKKTTQLKKLLTHKELQFIMEAHNGLSAKIVEETGFKGIWGSGLSISAAMGVRDNNEASWTQVLEVLEFMSDTTNIPILVDGDTGYGNFNNMRRYVQKLEQRGIAGVCIEDKIFPKTNSLLDDVQQPLADINEFCGKIKAAKDTQQDSDFCVIARVEAFIAGWGLEEAIKRAEAYRKAGADAVLIHSKRADVSEIESFMKVWKNRLPVVIVPTKYYTTDTDKFREMGISLSIWANHNMRASIKAMQQISHQIHKEETLKNVEATIVSVAEVFRLQGVSELQEAEKRYLPTAGKNVNSIVLAAGQGRLNELTKDIPKTLVKVNGKPILQHQQETYNQLGIHDITVIRGFKKDKIKLPNLNYVDNTDHDKTSELYSLYLAKDQLKEESIVAYGDILFKPHILHNLINAKGDIVIVVDADIHTQSNNQDWVKTHKPYSKHLFDQLVNLKEMSKTLNPKQANGEFIGLFKCTQKGGKVIKKALEKFKKEATLTQLKMPDLFNTVAKELPIHVQFIKGDWLDINTIVDLEKAGGF